MGRDKSSARPPDSASRFQSTRPHGARLNHPRFLIYCTAGFNPRARMGRDKPLGHPSRGITSFNPRARMGRDPQIISLTACRRSFNPRARMGRDGRGRGRHPAPAVSIHAPAWGATQDRVNDPLHWSFNPRARMGRDVLTPRSTAPIESFNPRARMGRDVRCIYVLAKLAVSIHAPAWGATKIHRGVVVLVFVSIHAPAWGATRGIVA